MKKLLTLAAIALVAGSASAVTMQWSASGVSFGGSKVGKTTDVVGYLVAASLLVALALSVTFRLVRSPSPSAAPAYGARDDRMSVDEMVATQNPDGSWQNDFLTRRNAAALRGIPAARVSYKKAVRYLNAKGLSIDG